MTSSILVIDDEKSMRDTFAFFLKNAGYDVVTAESYRSALDAIETHCPDVILADIVLPEHSGVDILHEVKNRGLTSPVILITGHPGIATARDAVREDAFDYVPKPVRKEALLRVTENALRHKQAIDDRIKAEKEKEQYRSHMEAIFRSVQEAIISVDTNMCIINANHYADHMFSMNVQGAAGKPLYDMLQEPFSICCDVLKRTLHSKTVIREYRVSWETDIRGHQEVVINCSPLIGHDDGFTGAVMTVRDITQLAELERELQERHHFHKLVGKSKHMQHIYSLLEYLSETETSVIITGESGTGKEYVAESLHAASSRALKPMVKVNCAALSESLLESELFGHVRGAFTGAVKDKTGRFQLADGGTILLDEIGDISPAIQLKLLRVLQEKTIERVGDATPIPVDVRVIAATNADLKQKIAHGAFREDLYYRLKVVELHVAPLRERREDIPLLVNEFCRRFSGKFHKNIEGISDDVIKLFMDYPWKGNVRELEHAVEHAYILCTGSIVLPDHLPADIKKHVMPEQTAPAGTTQFDEIIDALTKTDWNKAKAARLLGVSRQTIYRKMKALNIPDVPV